MYTQTPAFLLCDDILYRVQHMAFFKDFNFARTKALPVQVDQIPYCGIYFINELMLPDGDANVGMIRFRTSVRVGFSVIVQNNYSEAAEKKLDQAMFEIMNGLYTDPTFYIKKVQAFTRGERTHVYGTVGHDNETPVAELQFDLTCDLGVIDWPPVIKDVLETVHVDARPLLNPNAPLVHMEWDIPTNGGANVSANARQAKSRPRPAASGGRSTSPRRRYVDR